MNPKRKVDCDMKKCFREFCHFKSHEFMIRPQEYERFLEQNAGMTRCPEEWKITAVKNE